MRKKMISVVAFGLILGIARVQAQPSAASSFDELKSDKTAAWRRAVEENNNRTRQFIRDTNLVSETNRFSESILTDLLGRRLVQGSISEFKTGTVRSLEESLDLIQQTGNTVLLEATHIFSTQDGRLCYLTSRLHHRLRQSDSFEIVLLSSHLDGCTRISRNRAQIVPSGDIANILNTRRERRVFPRG